MIPAGELRQRVSIRVVTESSDGHDGFVDAVVTVQSRVPARIKPLLGRDLERARSIDPRISHEVTLRYWRAYRSDLAGGRAQLIYHDRTDRTFEVVSPPVDADERHVLLSMFCREAA